MKHFFSILISLILVSNILFAQNKQTEQRPRLIVGIVINQMRYDQINKYWKKYSNSGFKLLINNGTNCKNVHYNYLNINSASGYATISCGSYPSQHGIINLSWFDRLRTKEIYCVEDSKEKTVGTIFGTGKSPKNLSSISWTDQLRISTFKMSKVYSVSMEDYASILSGGKLANAAYWFNEQTGKWVTSSYYMDSLKSWVQKFNSKQFTNIYLSRTWNTTFPISKYTESLSDATSYEIGFFGENTFPYDMAVLQKGFNNSSLIKFTPFGNTFTKDFAINLIMNEYLGKDPYTDVLTVSFSATSNISDLFGLQSVELEDAYIKLDKDISHLIKAVENYVGKENVIFYLTSDRGACENPHWLKDINIETGEHNVNRSVVVLNSYFRAIFGLGDWINGYYNNEIYLNDYEIDKKKLSIDEFQHKSEELLINMQGISTIIATSDLKKGTYSSGIMKQAQNSFFPSRSGDLFLVLNYGWRFKTTKRSLCDCNSAFHENTHVPLIFYGKGIPKQSLYRNISMDDLATTLSFLMNTPLPNKATGNPISEVLQ